MHLSIVIPAYNEAERIGKTLEKYLNHFSRFTDKFEIVVVLNGCRDNTAEIVSKFVEQHLQTVKMLNIPELIGKGGAIRRGLSLAKGQAVGFVDADGATSPEEFEKLVANLKTYDAVIASRWKKGAKVYNRKISRKIISLIFAVLVKIIFWWRYYDTQCGAKVFNSSVIKKILPRLRTNNMAIDVDILQQCRKMKYRVKELPTIWVDQENSDFLSSPFRLLTQALAMVSSLIKIRFSN